MTTDIFVVRGVNFHSGSWGIQKGYVFLFSSSLRSTYILGLQGKYVMLQMFYCYFVARAEKFSGIFKRHNFWVRDWGRASFAFKPLFFFFLTCFGYLLQIYSRWNINIILFSLISLPDSCRQCWECSSESLVLSARVLHSIQENASDQIFEQTNKQIHKNPTKPTTTKLYTWPSKWWTPLVSE